MAGKKAGSLIAAEDRMIDDEFDDSPEIKKELERLQLCTYALYKRMKKKTADVDIKKDALKRK